MIIRMAPSSSATITMAKSGTIPMTKDGLNSIIPEKYNADNFFDTTDYIGAVKGATDTWYKNWTLSGTIDVQ